MTTRDFRQKTEEQILAEFEAGMEAFKGAVLRITPGMVFSMALNPDTRDAAQKKYDTMTDAQKTAFQDALVWAMDMTIVKDDDES